VRDALVLATEYSIAIIDWMALIVILIGTVETFFAGTFALLKSPDGHERRDVWLRYARWLVAGLTFQLAADILESAIAPSWNDIGRLAAIALIRTFLNYFLERDLTEIRNRQYEREKKEAKEVTP